MTYMKNIAFPIKADQFRTYAQKAVQCFLHKQFPKYFTVEEQEDLVSEVVLRMWRSMGTYDPSKGAFSTWVGTIARNVVRTEAQAKYNHADISGWLEEQELPLDESQYGLYRGMEMSADRELMEEELVEGYFSKLNTERDRRFLAWKLDGLDASEMAQREGISVENVHTVLCRMKQRLNRAA